MNLEDNTGIYYVKDESIYHGDCVIDNPAFIYSRLTGTVFKIGDITDVQIEYDRLRNMSNSLNEYLMLFTFDADFVDKEFIGQEMTKILTQTGYVLRFIENMEQYK